MIYFFIGFQIHNFLIRFNSLLYNFMESCINHRRFKYYKYEEENGDKRADKFKNNMLSMFGGMKTKHVKILINDVQQRMLMYTRLDLN